MDASFLWYSTGGYSEKDGSVLRTIQGFSTDAVTKLADEKWYKIYQAYWKDPAYADTFTSSACKGTNDFAPSAASPVIGLVSRDQGCKKGALYQNIWMYVIHEMEAAIKDCNNGNVVGKHWDEAVAFYTGSIPVSNGLPVGNLLFALSANRCKDFDTCLIAEKDDPINYGSTNNADVFDLFSKGKDFYVNKKCSDLVVTKESLVRKFTVPLIQSVKKYLYLSNTQTTNNEKERAELWSFSAAILPLINYSDPSVATRLRENSYIRSPVIVKDGYENVIASLETIYPKLGITCKEVGGLVNGVSGFYKGMEPCTDFSTSTSTGGQNDNDNPLQGWAIALIVIFVVGIIVGITFLICYYCRPKRYQQKFIEEGDSSELSLQEV